MNKYTRLFIDESRVYIPVIAAILRRLRAGCPMELDLREGHRLAHSIRGMALYEEQTEIAVLTGAMERGFEKLSDSGAHDTLLVVLAAAVPVLVRMIEDVEEHGAPRTESGDTVAALEGTL